MHGDPWVGPNPTDTRRDLDRTGAVHTALDLSEASGVHLLPTPAAVPPPTAALPPALVLPEPPTPPPAPLAQAIEIPLTTLFIRLPEGVNSKRLETTLDQEGLEKEPVGAPHRRQERSLG